MSLNTLIAELEEALKAAKLTGDKWTVGYTDVGPDDNPYLVAFLHDGDEENGPIICVDETPNGEDIPSPALHYIALMRNSLPTLIEAVKRQGEALEKIAHGEGIYGMQAGEYKAIARAALKETTDV